MTEATNLGEFEHVVLLVEAVLCIYQGFRGQWIWMQ